MRGLEWKLTAVADLMAIVDYISDDNPDAAQALKEDIETKVSRLPRIQDYTERAVWKAPAKCS